MKASILITRSNHRLATTVSVLSVGAWLFELLILAASYGAFLTAIIVFDLHHDDASIQLMEYFKGIPLIFFVVICTTFICFVTSGYIVTSLIARAVCVWKLPSLYLLLSPCLVLIHIKLFVLWDGGWKMTIDQNFFLTWGAATAVCTAYFGMRKKWQAA